MRSLSKGAAGFALAALFAFATPAGAAFADAGGAHGPAAPAVYVQTNDPGANAIDVYARAANGTLSAAGSYATGGRGASQPGAVVDPLASQGAVVFDRAHDLLFTVNTGSDSISTFTLDGLNLTLQQVVSSGGSFPTSIGVHDDLLYVMNSGGVGNVAGFRIAGAKLHPITSSVRSLGLANTDPPFFLDSPGQVGFSPDGRWVIVTTKRNGGIDLFAVDANGRLGSRVENASADAVPFAFDFDASGNLVLLSAASSALTTYRIQADGTLSLLSGPVADTQGAGCWIASAPGGFFFVGNTASASLSTFHVDASVSLVNAATPTDGGPIDLVVADGRFVYSENGGTGTIDEFQIGANGALTPIGTITGLAAHVIEGIAAS